MSAARIRLLASDLSYPADLQVHTAASGRIGSLSELYLVIERDDGFSAHGEVRANIPYLSKLPAEAIAPAILALVERMDWLEPPDQLLEQMDWAAAEGPPLARAAVESALVEGLARSAGVPVAALLGGEWHSAVPTNHCLFWGPDEQFDRLAARYVSEGFRDLKVRIAVGSFEQDLARLSRLRDRYGPAISIAVDANGSWSDDEAVRKLEALSAFDLAYVEQPTLPGDWKAFQFALARAPMPLMLDEGLARPEDIDQLAEIGSPAMGHLKIAKLGGPRPVVNAASQLAAAHVKVMIGQMNEGAMATALAAHCAMVARPAHAELYGCYGLENDVVSGVSYGNGAISMDAGSGLGVTLDESRCRLLWERRFA